MNGRKCALWLATVIGVLSFTTATVANAETGEQPCNGAVELCDRPLDQVVLPGTHNSMSNEEYGWALPNQHYSIPTQLEMGVRAFLIDTHYGKPFNGGPKIENSGRAQSTGMFLCHKYCLLGSSELIPELAKVADFLAANPREILLFVNQAGVTPDDFAQAVADSGLLPYVYTGSAGSYPTLEEMIDTGQRVVMLSEGGTGTVPWYHDGYAGAMQETPYDFRMNEAGVPLTTRQGMDLLINPATLNSTCRPFRGGTTGQLFLMNHWVNGLLDNSNVAMPDPEVAKVLNAREVLVARAKACEARRGELPNIVAVDDFGDGDLLTAVRELNGLTRPAITVKRPARRAVRAGRKAAFTVRITNRGDADAARAKLCAAVPRRLAFKPRCRTFELAQGETRKIRLKVKTRRRARGSGQVRFKVRGWGDVATARTKLKVKPNRKKRRHHRSRH